MKTYEKICIVCGKRFETTRHNKICCSRECQIVHHRKLCIEWNRQNKKHFKICEYCHAEFFSMHRNQKFCSHECFNQYRKDKPATYREKMRLAKQKKEEKKRLARETLIKKSEFMKETGAPLYLLQMYENNPKELQKRIKYLRDNGLIKPCAQKAKRPVGSKDYASIETTI